MIYNVRLYEIVGRCSSVVEQLFCKQQVVSSNLTVGSTLFLSQKNIMFNFFVMGPKGFLMDEKHESTVSKTVDAFEFIGSMATDRSREENKASGDKDVENSEENLDQDSVNE